MAYYEELRAASFAGIEFTATATTDGGGRRGSINEYPDLDNADFTDTGGKTKPFTLRLSLFEPNVIANSQSLKEALNKKQPGKLVHPTDGDMTVICIDWSSENHTGIGDEVQFTCEFLQVSESPTGVLVVKNPIATTPTVIQAALTAVVDDFSTEYSLEGQPDFLAEAAKIDFLDISKVVQNFLGDTLTTINNYTTNIEDFIKAPFILAAKVQTLISAGIRLAKLDLSTSKSVTSGTSGSLNSTKTQTLNSVSVQASNLPDQSKLSNLGNLGLPNINSGETIENIAVTGGDIRSSTIQVLNNSGVRITDSSNLVLPDDTDVFIVSRLKFSRAAEQTFSNSKTLQVFDLSINDIPTTTEPRQQQIKNATAIQNLTRNTAILEQAALHLDVEGQTLFNNREKALIALRETLTALNTIKTTQPSVSSAIDTVKANLASASEQLYGQLSGEEEITVPFSKNALVFAYEETGNFNNAVDIISRNNLPTFELVKNKILKVKTI